MTFHIAEVNIARMKGQLHDPVAFSSASCRDSGEIRSRGPASGAGLADIVKVTAYLADINDFAAMNEVYRKHFPDSPPARTTIALSLVLGAKFEMDGIAVIPSREDGEGAPPRQPGSGRGIPRRLRGSE